MSCDKIIEKLGFYIDGALDEHSLEEVEAHLKSCDQCRAELAAMQLILSAAREVEQIEPPADLRHRIAASTTAKQPRVPIFARLLKTLSPPAVRWAAGAAGLAVAVACIALSLNPAPQPAARTASRRPIAPAVTVQPVTPPAPMIAETVPSPAGVCVPIVRRVHRHARPQLVATTVNVPARKPASTKRGINQKPAAADDTANIAQTDTTTATVTMSAKDLAAAETAAVEVPVQTINRASLKIASQPAINQQQIQKWVDEAKTQATMHHGDSSDGLRLLSTRF